MSVQMTSESLRETSKARRSLWLLFERKVLLNVATAMFLLSTAIMLFEGISRAAFDSSAFWAEESVRYLMVWSFFLTLGVSGNAGNHIRTDLLLERLGPRARSVCHVASSLVGITFCALLFFASLPQVHRYYTMGMMTESNLDLPLWFLFLVMPIGALLFLAYYLRCLVIALKGKDPFGNGQITGSQL
ncbi:TRAP transporter small permease subunit [Pseudomonas syringae]|nr:TRAP transporter small permease subunit [Pseudomonas syringae]MCF5070101.1 TRAP transporter small permease subunit [Pseudomonas syringae]